MVINAANAVATFIAVVAAAAVVFAFVVKVAQLLQQLLLCHNKK